MLFLSKISESLKNNRDQGDRIHTEKKILLNKIDSSFDTFD